MTLNPIPVLQKLSHRSHSCFIYQNAEEQIDVTAQFIKIGLERGERCVFLDMPDKLERVRSALSNWGVDVEAQTRSSALLLSAKRDFLFHGRFNGERTMNFLQEALTKAQSDGFAGLRATGDMNWELGSDQDFQLLIDYEAQLDAFVTGHEIVGMCQYQRYSVSSLAICSALETHNTVMLGRELCSHNTFYEPPEIKLETDILRQTQRRSEWRCRQLSRIMDEKMPILH